VLDLPGWTGTDASEVWNGKGSPGDTSPAVDVLAGPEGVQAWAFGKETDESLDEFAAEFRRANAKAHPCPGRGPNLQSITVGGVPAVLDSGHCPAPGGPFIMTVNAVANGRGYVFFTYSIPPGSEQFTRSWFLPMLDGISFGT
jgi:hypothetical protein